MSVSLVLIPVWNAIRSVIDDEILINPWILRLIYWFNSHNASQTRCAHMKPRGDRCLLRTRLKVRSWLCLISSPNRLDTNNVETYWKASSIGKNRGLQNILKASAGPPKVAMVAATAAAPPKTCLRVMPSDSFDRTIKCVSASWTHVIF